jgi:dephospho-CoA kinase
LTEAVKPIIGIAGGIGAGKSTVAAMFAELGAAVVDADRLNHEELDQPEVLATLRKWWGDGVATPQGRADRQAIRRIVRDRPQELRRLEKLVHPRISRRSEELIAAYRKDPTVRAIVWDAPLLFEAGLAEQCNCIIFVDAGPEIRLQRLTGKPSWTAEDLRKLEDSQKPLDFKKSRADYIVENNTDRDAIRRQVVSIFSKILPG